MPLSNAERQKIFRQRKRNVTVGMVTDSNGLPHARLTRLAHNLADGMNDSQALVEAGFSRNSRDMLVKAKTGLADILKAKALTVETVVDSTTESIRATTPMLTTEGCIERPDWTARAAGRRDAIALLDRAGELPSAQVTQGGNSITVIIQRFDSHAPQDVVTDGQFTSNNVDDMSQAIDITDSHDNG